MSTLNSLAKTIKKVSKVISINITTLHYNDFLSRLSEMAAVAEGADHRELAARTQGYDHELVAHCQQER